MENLVVFYGEVVRDEFGGVDFSNCDSMEVAVIDMVNTTFADVRKCIRVPFGQGMRGMRMTVEALICVEGNDRTGPPRWGLRQVKNDTN
jgi:hypothetical protein